MKELVDEKLPEGKVVVGAVDTGSSLFLQKKRIGTTKIHNFFILTKVNPLPRSIIYRFYFFLFFKSEWSHDLTSAGNFLLTKVRIFMKMRPLISAHLFSIILQ